MIRPADFADIPALIAMCREAHQASRLRDFAFLEDRCYAGLYAKIADDCATWLVLVSDNNGVDGFIIGYAAPAYECLALTGVGHTALYTSRRAKGPVGLRLLNALHHWADRGGFNMKVHAVSDMIVDPERTGKLFERIGFRPAGRIYIRQG